MISSRPLLLLLPALAFLLTRSGADPTTPDEAHAAADEPAPADANAVIELYVGERIFRTHEDVLSYDPDSMLAKLVRFPTFDRRYFLDRDPEPFVYVLSYLRSGQFHWSPNSRVLLSQILDEAKYFLLPGLVAQVRHCIELQRLPVTIRMLKFTMSSDNWSFCNQSYANWHQSTAQAFANAFFSYPPNSSEESCMERIRMIGGSSAYDCVRTELDKMNRDERKVEKEGEEEKVPVWLWRVYSAQFTDSTTLELYVERVLQCIS